VILYVILQLVSLVQFNVLLVKMVTLLIVALVLETESMLQFVIAQLVLMKLILPLVHLVLINVLLVQVLLITVSLVLKEES